jgi:hypothetical protein
MTTKKNNSGKGKAANSKAEKKSKPTEPTKLEYKGLVIVTYEDGHSETSDDKTFKSLQEAMAYADTKAKLNNGDPAPKPKADPKPESKKDPKPAAKDADDDDDDKPDEKPNAPEKKEKFFEKHAEALRNAVGKPKNGDAIGLVDIYNVLVEIKKLLQGGAAAEAPKRTAVKNGKVKLSAAEKKEHRAELKAGMPYSNEALEAMKGSDIRMLGAALELKTFGVHPDEIRKQIKAICKGKKK